MAPSLTHVINAVLQMAGESNFAHSIGILNAMISVRDEDASLVLVGDGTAHTEALGELLMTATEQGVPVVTVQSQEALGAAFGTGAMDVIPLNGGRDHVQVVVGVVDEALAAGPAVAPAPAA